MEERGLSVCFRPAWTVVNVSGVLWLEFRLWRREELSEEGYQSLFLLMPISAALLLSVTGGHFLAQIVLSIGFFLAFSRSLALIPQERANPLRMVTSL